MIVSHSVATECPHTETITERRRSKTMITSGQTTSTRKFWKLESPGGSYAGDLEELNTAMDSAAGSWWRDHPGSMNDPEDIMVTVSDGGIIISYELEEK